MRYIADTTQQKARKIHFCNDCGKPILPGCEYINTRISHNGKKVSKKEHIHCDAVINAYCAETGNEVCYERLDPVCKWICDEVCVKCKYADECTIGGQEMFSCRHVLTRILSPTVLSAALQSAKDNGKEY